MVFRWLINLFRWKKTKKVERINKIDRIEKKHKIRRFVKKKKKFVDTEKKKFLVSSLMTRKIIQVSSSFTLEKVARILLKHKISGVPVFDKGIFVGEISKTDILNLVKKSRLEEMTEEDRLFLSNKRVAELMKKPICIYEDRRVEEAKKKMDQYNIKRLFVINRKNQLVGIITRTDLLKGVSKEEIKKTVSTKIDEMLRLLEEGPTDFSKISKSLKISEDLVEEWAKILEEHDLVEISYPPIGSPVLMLKSSKGS